MYKLISMQNDQQSDSWVIWLIHHPLPPVVERPKEMQKEKTNLDVYKLTDWASEKEK